MTCRNKVILGTAALLFFSAVYALSGTTSFAGLTGAFATSVISKKSTFWAISIFMGLAAVLAGYLTFVKK